MRDVKFLLSQDEKYDKEGNPSVLLLNLFDYYKNIGKVQVTAKQRRYKKLYNLAHGIIDKDDYIKEEVPDEIEFDIDTSLDDIGLNFYPIIPVFRNSILGDYDKKYIKYNPKAVNPENTNQVMESMDQDLRESMLKKAEQLFLSDNQEPTEEEYKLFQESETIKKKYQTTFRTKIEQWAVHTMKKEDLKFDMHGIGRQILDQEFITDDPTVHCNLIGGDYYPEVLQEANTFHIKSEESDCYSESVMFGWEEKLTLGSIFNKHSDNLSEANALILESWMDNYNTSGFVVNGYLDNFTGNRSQDSESTQNYINFKHMEQESSSREDSRHLVTETTIYFLLPRKVGYLTYKGPGTYFKDLVDENFKITHKPLYEKGYSKTEDSLISGEHIEWFYINELYRGKELSMNSRGSNLSTNAPHGDRIILDLKKHDIQYSSPQFRYGVIIPVYGGSVNNRFNQSFSPTEKCASWQIFFNWIWNRNAQLLATETGRFFAFNQLAIPHESMDESWGKNNLFKWAMTGRDTGFAPLDLSMSHMGQSAMQLGGGLGQMVDLNRTSDILEKARLASIVKQECYEVMGLTPDYVLGDISAKKTATSVVQGMQRSSTQIQYLHTRLQVILKNLRAGMLQTAQYLESQNPHSQISYLTPDGTREIFNTTTEGFLLHLLDVYIESNLSDIDALRELQQAAMMNNTMGADTLELATIRMSTSVPELMAKLTTIKADKEKEVKEAQEAERLKQEQALTASKEAQDKQLEYLRDKDEKDRQNKIDVALARSLSGAEDDAAAISREGLELRTELREMQHANQEFEFKQKTTELQAAQQEASINQNKDSLALQERIKLKELEQKDKELDIRRSEVVARNKRTKAIN